MAPVHYDQVLDLETACYRQALDWVLHDNLRQQSIPMLDGRTPRQAAHDPVLRPRLLRLLKQRVKACDERNLESGGSYDVNWLLRELGTTEILFDPPPARPRPDPDR